jgi:hypothetical protein
MAPSLLAIQAMSMGGWTIPYLQSSESTSR